MWKGKFRPVHPTGVKEVEVISAQDMQPQDIPQYKDYTDSDQQEFIGETPNYYLKVTYFVGGAYYYPLTDDEAKQLNDNSDNSMAEEELAETILGMIT